MDTEALLEEAQVRGVLREAHLGDIMARREFDAMVEKARDDWDDKRMTYLCYLKEVVMWELIAEYAELLKRM